MSLIGIEANKDNPPFEKKDFIFWMPQFELALDDFKFQKLYKIANNKIYSSIFGIDWEYAMSLCIAHYLELMSSNLRISKSKDLTEIAGGSNYKGVVSSFSIGEVSKTIDTNYTLLSDSETMFWNQTSYGSSLMALYKTKAVPSIFVVTGD